MNEPKFKIGVDSQLGAFARAEQLKQEETERESKMLKSKEKNTKTWAWNVAYYRGLIRTAQKEIVRATAKLNAAPKKGDPDAAETA